MKAKQNFVFNENTETYTLQLKKRRLWWLLLLLLPFLLLLLQIRMHKEVIFQTIDNSTKVVLSGALVEFKYPDRNFIDFKTFNFFTYQDIALNENTDNEGYAKFQVSYTLYSKLFHKNDLSTVVATGGCFQSDTLQPVYHQLKNKEVNVIELSARMTKIIFEVIDNYDKEPLPNADVVIDYYISGQKQTITLKSDPRGIVEAEIMFCSEKVEVNASHFGYQPFSASGDVDYFSKPENRLLPLDPIMKPVEFIVKDLYTKQPVSNATAKMIFDNSTLEAITNTNGIGKGMFDSVAIAKEMYIHVSHPAYHDTTTIKYIVDDFIKLPEDERIIYIRPKAGNFVFYNVDKYTKKPVQGVKNEVYVNGNSVGVYYSNSNGEFTVPNLKKSDNITIIASKPDYVTNDFTIKNKNVSELEDKKDSEIPMEQYVEPDRSEPPREFCRAHFSGTLLSDVYVDSHISLIYKPDKFGEYVGEGEYSNNTVAFPNAVNTTFDAIAVDKGTRVILYSEPNFKGKVLLDVKGPALINNVKWKSDTRIGNFKTATLKEPYESLFPKSCRQWSSEDMNKWSKGSVKVICE